MTEQLRRRELDCACTRTGSTPPGATLAGVVLRLGDHGFDRRRLAAPCPAPRRAKRAMPAVRNAKPALAWRYPTRTPARVRITSPPTAGRATAASAASETATGRSWRACRGNDRTPIGMAPLGAGGAIPGSDDARPASLIAPKMDAKSPRALQPRCCRPPARPGHRKCRTSRNCDATDAPAVADSPAPSMPPNPFLYWLHPRDAQQERGKVGLQLRQRDDRTGNRGEHVLNRRDDVRNWRDHIRNRRDRRQKPARPHGNRRD